MKMWSDFQSKDREDLALQSCDILRKPMLGLSWVGRKHYQEIIQSACPEMNLIELLNYILFVVRV